MELLNGLFTLFLFVAGFVLVVAVFFQEEIKSTKERDPAATGYLQIILLYAGLHALIGYKISSALWKANLKLLARAVSQFTRFLTGIEIHPAAVIGRGLFIDHGMGVVVGETSIIGENVTLFQGVTLGGTGKETGKRHPTLGNNIVVGAGAKILGNIVIGDNTYVGANAVVLRDIPANSTVVGVPGHITKQDGKKIDIMLDHAQASDPIMQHLKDLLVRIKTLEDKDKH
ncbi:MAG: serine O-acetyltransferase [Candidatus Omnitrophota bacterium]|jgi:serine O-acetyltransferase|nr:serine O-acetyltransferase [Candidatus Omnitrophota bacterium]